MALIIEVTDYVLKDSSSSKSAFTSRHMMSTVVGTIKKIATGYIGGAR